MQLTECGRSEVNEYLQKLEHDKQEVFDIKVVCDRYGKITGYVVMYEPMEQ